MPEQAGGALLPAAQASLDPHRPLKWTEGYSEACPARSRCPAPAMHAQPPSCSSSSVQQLRESGLCTWPRWSRPAAAMHAQLPSCSSSSSVQQLRE